MSPLPNSWDFKYEDLHHSVLNSWSHSAVSCVFISYAQTHTHTRLVVCLGFVTYLHHCCVTTAPPLLCCLIVSIHPRQLYLKPPSDISARVSSPYSWDVYLYPSLLFLCSRVTGLSFFVVAVAVNLSFGKLPICQAGVLHSPSHTKKGKKGGSKDDTKKYSSSDHGLISFRINC